MKKTLIIILVFFLCMAEAYAQLESTSFVAGGIKVIFKPTLKKVINVRIYFKGGVTNYTAKQAGIENITLDAATKCGTEKYNSVAFKDTADKYGILSYGASTLDYGYIEVNCVKKYFDKAWDLLTEAVMTPAFEAKEVKLLKGVEIGKIKDYESNPENYLYKLQLREAFSNSPYAIDPSGNDESINSLTADDLKNYYRTLLNKNKMFIVIVGDITKQEIYEKILLSFSAIPSASYIQPDFNTPVFNDKRLSVEKRDLKINYVGAIMNAPQFTSIDYVPFRIGISGLGGNIFNDLRRQNLAYSASSATYQLRLPFARMFAATNNPQNTMNEMFWQLKKIRNGGMEEEWLRHIKNVYLTMSYLNDQSASAITNNLGRAEILGGWQYAEHLTKLVEMTTVQQVNDALNFYIGNVKWTLLSNSDDTEGIKLPAY